MSDLQRRRNRWRAWLLVAAVVLVVLLSVPKLRQGVSRGNYDRIKTGMTLTQVESLLGQPVGELDLTDGGTMPPRLPSAARAYFWQGSAAGIFVGFDEGGGVVGKVFEPLG